MREWIFCGLAAMTMITGCATHDDAPEGDSQPIAIGFSLAADTQAAGSGGPAETRAGEGLFLNDDTRLREAGFGVFAAYTGTDLYHPVDHYMNFMYNQKVEYDNAKHQWKYEPVKYWPGFDPKERLTFFAYAPYVPDVDAATGSASTGNGGLVSFVRQEGRVVPYVTYQITADAAVGYDLMWARPLLNQTATPQVSDGVYVPDIYQRGGSEYFPDKGYSRFWFHFAHALGSVGKTIRVTNSSSAAIKVTKLVLRGYNLTSNMKLLLNKDITAADASPAWDGAYATAVSTLTVDALSENIAPGTSQVFATHGIYVIPVENGYEQFDLQVFTEAGGSVTPAASVTFSVGLGSGFTLPGAGVDQPLNMNISD